jgi:hypothetical protein
MPLATVEVCVQGEDLSFGDGASSGQAASYWVAGFRPLPQVLAACRRLALVWALLAPALSAHAALTINSISLPTLIGRGQTVTATANYVRLSGSGLETVAVNVPAELEVAAPLPAACALAGAPGTAQTLTCPAVDPGSVGAAGSFSFGLLGRTLGGGQVSATNGASVARNAFSVVSGGDLSLVKTMAPGAVLVNGQSPTFTLTPSLTGDALPSGAGITITDQFPGSAGEFTLAAYTAPGYSCNTVTAANTVRRLVCTISGPGEQRCHRSRRRQLHRHPARQRSGGGVFRRQQRR